MMRASGVATISTSNSGPMVYSALPVVAVFICPGKPQAKSQSDIR
jgi:hypothetical protein